MDEFLHRAAEGVVGMMCQHVPRSDRTEEVRRATTPGPQWPRHRLMTRSPAKVGTVQAAKLTEPGDVQEDLRDVDVAGQDVQLVHQQVPYRRRHGLGHLQANHGPEAASQQFGLDRGQQILGLLLIDGQVGVARHPEAGVLVDLHSGEQRVEVGGDHLLQRDETLTVGKRKQPPVGERHLDAGEAAPAGLGVGQADAEARGEIRDVREGMTRVDGQGRQDGVDPIGELPLQELAVIAVQVGPVHEPDSIGGEGRKQVVLQRPFKAPEKILHRVADGRRVAAVGSARRKRVLCGRRRRGP